MWARLDDQLIDHPKVAVAGKAIGPNGRVIALGFFSMALMWCNKHLSDGVLPLEVVEGFRSYVVHPVSVADALVHAGLFEKHNRGYRIHDYTDYNPTASQVKKRRADRHAARVNGRE